MGILKSFFGGNAKRSDFQEEIVAPPTRLERTMTRTDLDKVGMLLHWINDNTLFTLPDAFIADVVMELPDIAVNQTRSFTTNLVVAHKPQYFRLNIFMDAVDKPDLYFFGSADVIAALHNALPNFKVEEDEG